MKKRKRVLPRPGGDVAASVVVSQAGGLLLTETICAVGLDPGAVPGVGRWRKPLAVHNPAKVLCDLAVALGLGGDCLATSRSCAASPRLTPSGQSLRAPAPSAVEADAHPSALGRAVTLHGRIRP